jgi:hypothetical protein
MDRPDAESRNATLHDRSKVVVATRTTLQTANLHNSGELSRNPFDLLRGKAMVLSIRDERFYVAEQHV